MAVENQGKRIAAPAVVVRSVLPDHCRHQKKPRRYSIALKSRFHSSASAAPALEF